MTSGGIFQMIHRFCFSNRAMITASDRAKSASIIKGVIEVTSFCNKWRDKILFKAFEDPILKCVCVPSIGHCGPGTNSVKRPCAIVCLVGFSHCLYVSCRGVHVDLVRMTHASRNVSIETGCDGNTCSLRDRTIHISPTHAAWGGFRWHVRRMGLRRLPYVFWLPHATLDVLKTYWKQTEIEMQ